MTQRNGDFSTLIADADLTRLAPATPQQTGFARLLGALRTAHMQRFAIVSSA